MPAALLPALILFWQAGPLVWPGAAPPIPQLPLRGPSATRRSAARATTSQQPGPGRLDQCLALAERDPTTAKASAEAWLRAALGETRAEPLLCRGAILAGTGDWQGAERAFSEGHDAVTADRALRGRLGGMAGNAALAQGAAERALPLLDAALADLAAGHQPALAGEVQIDRARALVALKRPIEAATALGEARRALPDNAEAWLLSATLARRQGQLADAQTAIETAARLRPADPETGLEAGVIAMLAGHADAARKSWQSVLATSPDSAAATQARDYLAQLDEAPAKPPGGTASREKR
ncbi:MAG: hypothetical protein JSS36_09030 [Proteobacteria bacterium]|nr:hypothetical protein [Pseudomonadota bacterium]